MELDGVNTMQEAFEAIAGQMDLQILNERQLLAAQAIFYMGASSLAVLALNSKNTELEVIKLAEEAVNRCEEITKQLTKQHIRKN